MNLAQLSRQALFSLSSTACSCDVLGGGKLQVVMCVPVPHSHSKRHHMFNVVVRLTSHLQLNMGKSIQSVESVLSWRRVSCEQQLDSKFVFISLRKLECSRHALDWCCRAFAPCANALLRPGRMFPSSLLAMLWWPLCLQFLYALSATCD